MTWRKRVVSVRVHGQLTNEIRALKALSFKKFYKILF
jgi:hypothetical protein